MITATLPTTVNIPQLVHAIALIESGNRNVPAAWDRHQYSWGIWQCGQTRWIECGGTATEWGNASPARQLQVVTRGFTTAHHRLRRRYPHATSSELILRLAFWWNGCKIHDSYARRTLQLYQRGTK